MIWVVVAAVALVVLVFAIRALTGNEEPQRRFPAQGKTAGAPQRQLAPAKEAEAKREEVIAELPKQDPPPAERKPAIASMPPPPNEFDEDWDDVDITMVGEMPEEIRALQKGYRAIDPRQAVAERLEYDATAEIEVVSEAMVDDLLVEELLCDDGTGPNALIDIRSAGRTDVGRRRKNNEDSLLMLPEHFVFVVADGMGGHAAGELASSLAVDTIQRAFESGQFDGEPNTLWPRRGDELARSVEMANAAIFAKAGTNESLSGMGTTIAAIRFCPERQRAYIAHVGDSRCYRIRGGQLAQLTRDHTLGAELGATGRMATHLSRSVGIGQTVQVELMVDAPQDDDVYLLCSDGLTKMVEDPQMVEIVVAHDDIQAAVDRMIDNANAAGGKDNVTVVVLRIQDLVKNGLLVKQPASTEDTASEADEELAAAAPSEPESHEAATAEPESEPESDKQSEPPEHAKEGASAEPS